MLELSPLETAMNASASRMPGLLEHVAIEPEADDRARVLAGGIAIERLGALVDDGDLVAGVAERVRQLGADPTASHDQDPHGREAYPRVASPDSVRGP